MIQELKNLIEETSGGNNLGEKIIIVGATKTVPAETINLAIENGLKVVAENKVQEFCEKTDKLIGAEQQFIGHLQTNKVKYLVGKVSLIQSVDSIHLAEEIGKFAVKRNVTQDILAEINVGGELSKSGFTPQNAAEAVKLLSKISGINVKGLMAMLPKNAETMEKEKLCLQMRNIYDNLKKDGFNLSILSMGMSKDYKIAIKCGSNMIRIGSLIFGERSY